MGMIVIMYLGPYTVSMQGVKARVFDNRRIVNGLAMMLYPPRIEFE
jgi:hypothetical protein